MKLSLWRLGGLTLGILAGVYFLKGGSNSRTEPESPDNSPGGSPRNEQDASEWFSDRTLSPIHHELRNDLNLLTNYSELMKHNTNDAHKILMVSRKLTNSIEALISSLRLQAEEFQPQPEKIPLKSFIDERINWFQPLFDYLEKDLTLELDGSPQTVTLDRRYFELILNSLLVESSEPPGGSARINISEACDSNQWTLQLDVQEHDRPWGENTVEELRDYLTAESPSELVNKFSPGTGLRLFGVHELVNRHGGRFVLKGRENNGVIFRCLL